MSTEKFPQMPRMFLADVAEQLFIRGQALLDGIEFIALDENDEVISRTRAADNGDLVFNAARDGMVVRVVTGDQRVMPLDRPMSVRKGDNLTMNPIREVMRSIFLT